MAKSQKNLFNKFIEERNAIYKKNQKGWRYSLKIKALIIILTIMISTVFYIFHFNKTDYYNTDNLIEAGQKWDNPDLVAEFTFPVYKSQQQLQKEISNAESNALNVFTLQEDAESLVQIKIDNFIEEFKKIGEQDENVVTTEYSSDIVNALRNMDEQERKKILANIENQLDKFIDKIYESGFVNVNIGNIEQDLVKIKVASNNFYVVKKTELFDRNSISDYYRKFILPRFPENSKEIVEYLLNEINTPNLLFDDKLTKQNKEIAASNVPKTIKIVKKGTTIVKKGEEVDEITKAAILSYRSSSNIKNENVYTIFSFLGSIGHAALLITILMLYLLVMRKKIFHDNMQLIALCTLIIISAFLSWLSIELSYDLSLEYLVFIPSFVMLTAIVFDSRTAFYVTITLSLMLAGIRGSDYVIGVTMIFSGILAAYTVRDIQNRTQMFQSTFFIFIGLLLPIFIFGAERSIDFDIILERSLLALVNSVASPLLTFGLLFVLEKFTDTTTDLQLKEYDDINHPLLQKMNEIAPGTYQHTMAVSMLAERCASAIGANPLLTKVGSYFHDIGKIARAEYFTENQVSIENKHEQISPKKSVQIIKEHVVEGIVLANKYKLPTRIIDFIPMHHGTTLIKHFYAKALEDKGEDVNQEDYRYPGPKPNSKETAILMICDSAEAISRISDKKVEQIEEIINENIQNRILDGQFDECDITMNELNKIKEVLARNLIGISHQRTSYKEIPNDNKQK